MIDERRNIFTPVLSFIKLFINQIILMKIIIPLSFCLAISFVACTDTTPSKKADAEVGAPSVSMKDTVATAVAAVAALPVASVFSVKYVGGKGFYVNGELLGNLDIDRVPKILSDSMIAFTKRGGVLPKDLALVIVHDPKTDAPLMGESGALRDAFGEAVKLAQAGMKK